MTAPESPTGTPLTLPTTVTIGPVTRLARWEWHWDQPWEIHLAVWDGGGRLVVPFAREPLRALLGGCPVGNAAREVRVWVDDGSLRVVLAPLVKPGRRAAVRTVRLATCPVVAREFLTFTAARVALCPCPVRCARCPECEALAAAVLADLAREAA